MKNDERALSNRRPPRAGPGTLFDDRYGPGAYDQLLDDLRRPCVTFAAIAKRYGVTRERVRQWRAELLPDAPSGHQRQRQCAWQKRRRRLLEDPLFRAFFSAVRVHLANGRVELIKGADGYRKRSVRIGGRTIALAFARRVPSADSAEGSPAYALAPIGPTADFVYFQLPRGEHLLVPRRELSSNGVVFIDEAVSPLQVCKNTFAGLDDARAGRQRAPIECRC